MNEKIKPALQSIALIALIVFLVFGTSFISRNSFPSENFEEHFCKGPECREKIGYRLNEIPFLEEMAWIKIIISSLTLLLLIYLLYNYLEIYNKVKSEFSLGLIIMVLALFAYAITDNPLIHLLFGFRGAGLGPFSLMPSVFAFISALVLVYLSTK